MCQEDEDNISKSLHDAWDEEIIQNLADLDINKQSHDHGHIVSKLNSEELPKEGETYISTVSTIPAGLEQRVNVNLIIERFNLQCKEFINLHSEQQIKDGEEGEICTTLCGNPAGFEQCACNMIINVKILGKTIH